MNTHFYLFLTARLTSSIGASLSRVAIPLAIYENTQSSSLTAATTFIMLAPLLVFGIPAGAFADRMSRLRLMRTMELVSGVVLTILVLLFSIIGLVPFFLLLAVAIISTAAVFFDASSFGFVPRLVGSDNLGSANSYLYGGNTIVSLLGPALGGIIYATSGLSVVLIINVTAYAVALVFLNLIRVECAQETKRSLDFRSLSNDMMEGITVIWSSAVLRHLVFIGLSNAIAGGALLAALIVICNERFSSNGVGVGAVLTLMGGGAFVGSVVLGRVSRRIPQSRITLACLPLGIVFFLSAIFSPNLILFCIAAFFWELTYAMLIINNITLRQSLLPGSLQSRVNSTARTLSWGGEPLGALIVTGALVFTSYQVALIACVLPLAAVTLFMLKSPLRNTDLSAHSIPDSRLEVSR
ncbi:MFS transporter [Arthrobacter sp. CG_A4]|uniref:MFS transporter n=1 Tax=Arthrobacter sp. CG_A4 TaxID=3071706 RepID=UPI002DF935E0|nr:MFS family permease [Arthrobacter sp. CG_A4]